MTLGHRVFAVEGDDITRISQNTFSKFYFRHEPALPQYAGRQVHFALVIYSLHGRRPKEIIRIDNMRLGIGDQGELEEEKLLESTLLSMKRMDGTVKSNGEPKGAKTRPGNLINAEAIFDDRRYEHMHPKLSGLAHERILADLFR